MKKYLILIALFLFSIFSFATDRVLPAAGSKLMNVDVLKSGSVTWSYTGMAADTLTGNQDTIAYNITLNKSFPMNYYIKLGLDTIAGADTTLLVNINGRMFNDQSWTLIKATTTAEIAAAADIVIESMTESKFTLVGTPYVMKQDTVGFLNYPADTIFVPAITYTHTPSIKTCWRQIQVEIIYNGPDYTGEGIKLNSIDWYFQEVK